MSRETTARDGDAATAGAKRGHVDERRAALTPNRSEVTKRQPRAPATRGKADAS